jgi:hypothetical protein
MSGRYLQNLDLQQEVVFDEAMLGAFDVRDQSQKQRTRSQFEINLKRFYGKYFYLYLNSLIGKAVKPRLAVDIKEVTSLIAELEQQISHTIAQAKQSPDTQRILQLITQ